MPAALEVAFNTGAETAKGRALRGHRRVSLLVDDETPPFSFVKLTGRVTLREDLVEVRACATRIGGAIWVSTEPRSSVPATACWASCSFGCGLTGCSPSGPSPDDASKSIRRRGGAALDEEAHGALRGRRPGHERLTAVVGDAARRGSVAALADLIDNDAVHAGVLQLGTRCQGQTMTVPTRRRSRSASGRVSHRLQCRRPRCWHGIPDGDAIVAAIELLVLERERIAVVGGGTPAERRGRTSGDGVTECPQSPS